MNESGDGILVPGSSHLHSSVCFPAECAAGPGIRGTPLTHSLSLSLSSSRRTIFFFNFQSRGNRSSRSRRGRVDLGAIQFGSSASSDCWPAIGARPRRWWLCISRSLVRLPRCFHFGTPSSVSRDSFSSSFFDGSRPPSPSNRNFSRKFVDFRLDSVPEVTIFFLYVMLEYGMRIMSQLYEVRTSLGRNSGN